MRFPSTPTANAAAAQSRLRENEGEAHKLPLGRAREHEHFVVGARASAVLSQSYDRRPDDPVYRPLRIYALDPSASIQDGAHAIVNVPYEPVEATANGLRGAILEVVDEASGVATDGGAHFDLEDRFVLMQQGRRPSPEDPHFRRQMAYAVASTTYATFRLALGREVAWGFHRRTNDGGRLRIRPCVHDLQNAYYDPRRGELYFGSFAASAAVSGRNVPRGEVSLCLSHDVLVHEMSHALLDGMRSHFLHPSNIDVLAFHEGFADLIAIFQRFSYRDVVGKAIRDARADLGASELLANIAVQFAQAMNATGALRSARSADELRYEDTVEPHQRGEILVNAVFNAFVTVFQRKTQSLMRIATDGTGVLPQGEIPELLAVQLTERACRLASQFLSICIRAIDYCPPVDVSFGEFLRAVITADFDLVPDDRWAYREAWIDAFARRRIYPEGVPSLSEDALRWAGPERALPREPELSFGRLRFDGDPGRVTSADESLRQACAFGQLAADPRYRDHFGLAADGDPLLFGDAVSLAVVESVRSSRRVGPSGQVVFDLIAEITQCRRVAPQKVPERPGFDFYGGATVILDPQGAVRYIIRKSVLDGNRLERQRQFIQKQGAHYFGRGPEGMDLPEPGLLLRLHKVTRPQLRSGAGTRALLRDQVSDAEYEAAQRYLVRRHEADPPKPWLPLLKSCLNACMALDAPLDVASPFDLPAERAVVRLQTEAGVSVDGIVGPATWTVIARRLREAGVDMAALAIRLGAPGWVRGLLGNDPRSTVLADIDSETVLDMYQFSFGLLSPGQRQGLGFLLSRLAADDALTDIRFGAYMLATVKHECADTWLPIEEIGKGAGRPYGKAVEVIDECGRSCRWAYYGRGYVQLTWRENYTRLGDAIGDPFLVLHPERALEPIKAYQIMSHGMRRGLFTSSRLTDHIHDGATDYVGARKIINGNDRAALVAGHAARFETMLLASVTTGLTA